MRSGRRHLHDPQSFHRRKQPDGKQYVAIASCLYATGRRTLVNSPEVKEQRNATVSYVFGL